MSRRSVKNTLRPGGCGWDSPIAQAVGFIFLVSLVIGVAKVVLEN